MVVVALHAPSPQVMAAVPAVIPVTTPVDEMVAADRLPLIHVTPGVASVSVIIDPAHTLPAPVIAAGVAFTVTVAVTVQPLPNE